MELSNIKTKIASVLSRIKPIYLIILVIVIITGEAFWAYKALNNTNQFVGIQPKSQISLLGNKSLNVISLAAPKNEIKIGEMIPVGINIESDKTTAGTDIIIHYDANLLSLAPNSIKTPVSLGSLYDEYPINQADEKNGIITVSGISNKTVGVIPNGLFGTILFQAKAAGSAKVFLEFSKNKTNDTNIIENKNSSDVLEEVKNLDLKITP